VDNERLLHLLAQQTREHAFVLVDLDGRIVWWNRGAEHLFGHASAEIVGQPMARLFTPEDVRRGMPTFELRTAEQDGAAEDDTWMMRADGSRFWASGAVTPLTEQGKLVAYGKVLRDRTDQKEQLEALRNQAAALVKAGEHKNLFLSTLGHELRNTLAPLMNALQLIRMAHPDDTSLHYPINLIDRQAEFIRRLVDDLLDVTRISAGKMELKTQRIDLRDVISRAVDTMRPAIEERGHELNVIMLDTPIVVDGDADRLLQVFVNLIDNAAKYTPNGGHIILKAMIEGEEAVSKVQDDGIGIPEEMQARIFELFTQVEESLPKSAGGLGIGLSLVKQLVVMHHGSVQVRSDGIGKGSEFVVRLPLAG
jgi:PAS domain S-box-containing protein